LLFISCYYRFGCLIDHGNPTTSLSSSIQLIAMSEPLYASVASSGVKRLPNPCDESSYFSYLFFQWPEALIELGNSKTLTEEDLPEVSKEEDTKENGARLRRMWNEEVEKHGEKASLSWALHRTFWKQHWYTGLLLLSESVVRLYQAMLLGYLVKYFLDEPNGDSSIYNNGYYISALLCVCGLYNMMIHHHAFFLAWRLGLQLRISLTSLMYDKSVNLSLRALSKVSTILLVQAYSLFPICIVSNIISSRYLNLIRPLSSTNTTQTNTT